MKRIACALIVALFLCSWSSSASADTDRVARIKVKKLEATVGELETKITALQLQLGRLQQENAALAKKIDANYALIQVMARQLTEPR